MSSQLFETIGLGNLDIGYVILGIIITLLLFIILNIVFLCKNNTLKKKYLRFMQGKDAKSLEKDIIGLYEDNKFLKINTENNKKEIRSLSKQLDKAYQKVGLVKYDAFREMGGKLSFSLALLNANDTGIILNSVHSADGCYSYTKEIKNGFCEIELGDEEKKALNKAMGI